MRTRFQPWMILLVLPLLGLVAMLLVLVSGEEAGSLSDETTPVVVIDDQGTPLPQTLPPRTPPLAPTSVLDQIAPDIALTDLNGDTFRLQDYRGRAVVVNFWATWCEPCKEEMPELQAYQDDHEDVVIILVTDPEGSVDGEEGVRSFIEELGLTMRVGLDPFAPLHYAFGVPALPSSFFIDDQGMVRGRRYGQVSYEDLAAELALLDETE